MGQIPMTSSLAAFSCYLFRLIVIKRNIQCPSARRRDSPLRTTLLSLRHGFALEHIKFMLEFIWNSIVQHFFAEVVRYSGSVPVFFAVVICSGSVTKCSHAKVNQ